MTTNGEQTNEQAARMLQARMQMHMAAEWISRVPRWVLPEEQGDKRFALHWNTGWMKTRSFNMALLPPPGWCVELETSGLVLGLNRSIPHDPADTYNVPFPLEGRTQSHIGFWLMRALDHGGINQETAQAIYRTPYQLYPDFVDSRSTFSPAALAPELKLLCNWFTLAQNSLERCNENHSPPLNPEAEILIWPHHFDMAVAHKLSNNRLMTLGFSPGDRHISTPYFYVNLWPWPEADFPTPPAPAYWHHKGFNSLVLPSDTLSVPHSAAARKAVLDFHNWAIPTGLDLLGVS